MAVTNGARKALPVGQSTSRANANSVLDTSLYDKLMTSEDKKSVKIIIRKKSQTTQSEPGNWQDSKSSRSKPKLPNTLSKNGLGPSPPLLVNSIDSRITATFPSGKPFDETGELVQCKHCKKPVYKSAAPSHIRDCLRRKQEKLQKKKEAKEAKDAALRKERNGGISPDPTGDDAGGKSQGSARKGAADAEGLTGAKKTSKKRKADDDAKGPNSKKKKKDEPKAKTAKPKGPVDVEKQCGVILSNGAMCARSLTCKSHSMGAKRAVPGRSTSYDILLAQYQRKNQAKLHRAAMDANAPMLDEFEPQGPIDSDEERDSVMKGINQYYRQDNFTGGRTMGAPLETSNHVPLRRRYNYIRLKGAIQQAIGGVHGSKLFATPATISTGLFGGITAEASTPMEPFHSSRQSSVAPHQRQMPAAARKPSLSGAV